MDRIDLNNLSAFVVVARERSFTRAAARLGVSQSALSHTIRGLEEKLGVRLLTRTTRGVSPTELGEKLFEDLLPHYEGIAAGLKTLSEGREKPGGTIRISAHDHAAGTILWPKLSPLLPAYPDFNIEITISYAMIDIVTERYDAGVRLGDRVAKDMIAMRIGSDFRHIVVGAPAYFAQRSVPLVPQDLTSHNCTNLRLATHGGLYAWEFARDGKELEIQVQGQVIVNTTPQMLAAALGGYALAYLPEDLVSGYLKDGSLVQVLAEWCPATPGYHLYYPSRKHTSPAFKLVVEALRYENPAQS